MSKNKINKIAEEKAFDYQRELGMIDSICDDHIVARRMGFYDGFIAGYKLHEANTPLPEDTVIFQKGIAEGKRLMLEDAVECSVYAGKEGGKWIVSYIGNYESMLKTCKAGDTVRVIVLPKED